MDIYVQSRGFDQEQDYCWVQITRDGTTKRQLPPLSKEVINLIQGDAPSVVLERLQDERLLLLITGIEPEGRVDFLERQIRIFAAWVGNNSEEPVLRRVAIRALKEEERKLLTEEINQAVILQKDPEVHNVAPEYISEVTLALQRHNFASPQDLVEDLGLPSEIISRFINGESVDYRNFINISQRLGLEWQEIKESYITVTSGDMVVQQANQTAPERYIAVNSTQEGFHATFQDMLRFVSADESKDLPSGHPPDPIKKIGRNSPKLRNKLAEELQRCHLPTEQGPLVVVTGIKKRETLENAGVWRSLSTLVDTDDWEEIPDTNIWKDYQNILVWPMFLITIIQTSWERLVFFCLSLKRIVSPNDKDDLN